jgi:ectoine hydroxylase-related dioxygenase (phytanoyl-CoA dioxygenase family)
MTHASDTVTLDATGSPIGVTEEQKRQYREEGYFFLEGVIPAEHVAALREELQWCMDSIHSQMDRAGKDVIGINHRNRRYFISNRAKDSPRVRRFIYSPLMAAICRATLGPDAYLFHEQYVVKAAERGLKFGWHQDSGYVGHSNHKPYLSCWCALDDMTEANGTVYVLPFSRAGVRSRVEHVREEGSNDLVGYHGDDPGVPAVVPAGSIVVFSSMTFHRSTANTTSKPRRVYLPQYSCEPILTADGTRNWALAEPFLRNGEVIAKMD